jgi:hypothetical protein
MQPLCHGQVIEITADCSPVFRAEVVRAVEFHHIAIFEYREFAQNIWFVFSVLKIRAGFAAGCGCY